MSQAKPDVSLIPVHFRLKGGLILWFPLNLMKIFQIAISFRITRLVRKVEIPGFSQVHITLRTREMQASMTAGMSHIPISCNSERLCGEARSIRYSQDYLGLDWVGYLCLTHESESSGVCLCNTRLQSKLSTKLLLFEKDIPQARLSQLKETKQ